MHSFKKQARHTLSLAGWACHLSIILCLLVMHHTINKISFVLWQQNFMSDAVSCMMNSLWVTVIVTPWHTSCSRYMQQRTRKPSPAQSLLMDQSAVRSSTVPFDGSISCQVQDSPFWCVNQPPGPTQSLLRDQSAVRSHTVPSSDGLISCQVQYRSSTVPFDGSHQISWQVGDMVICKNNAAHFSTVVKWTKS